MSVFADKLRQQISEGIGCWKAPAQTPEALDLFEVEVVEPLRELQAEGSITLAKPHIGNFCFGQRIDAMVIKEIHWNLED